MNADALAQALAACAEEPIHVPGSVQPHGALLVLSPDAGRVLQASGNAADVTGVAIAAGDALDAVPGATQDLLPTLQAWATAPEGPLVGNALLGGRRLQLRAHAGAQGLLVEITASDAQEQRTFDALFPRAQRFLADIESETDIVAVCAAGTRELRRLTGYDRVLAYRFDDDWHGTVLAEDGNGVLPSYLDLRFPASDIPAQARELYRRNRVRVIPDAGYAPVPVLPAASPIDGRALDLSAVGLRSVSPVHLEYMRNMGTAASLSVSIVVDGRLWGLLACHNAAPKRAGPALLAACDFLGQMLALQLGARERAADSARRLAAMDLQVELLARLSRAGTVQAGLAECNDAWLRLTGAAGAAVLIDDGVLTAGRTPDAVQLQALAQWIRGRAGDQDAVFATHALPALYAPAAAYADVAAGVLAVSISALYPHYVLWFRPERVQTVRWGGQPDKLPGDDGRLRPRRSFAIWSETVRGQSERWRRDEVDTAASFRNGVVNFVLKQAEERAALTEQLQASNNELEAFSYSVSHDLRAPFRHIVGYAQLLREDEPGMQQQSRHYLDSMVDAALSAGRLVDDLLNFSQLGRSSVDVHPVDMAKIVAELRQSSRHAERERNVEWRIGTLPPAHGDGALLRQAMANLVENALKYTRHRDPAIIEISGEERGHETVYTVRDNGAGFDMAYVGKLFGVFQRLHRIEEYEGSGIGLALARRIVDRHGGWIAAEGRLDAGATFRIGLPKPREPRP